MKRISVFVAAALSLTAHSVPAQLASSAWPMFRHDARHTGQSEHVGSQTGKLLWSYVIISTSPHSSPSVDPDGSVYIGTSHGICSLSPTGSLSWSYMTGDRIDAAPAIGIDGRIYVGCLDYRFYAFNSGGALSWSYYGGVLAMFVSSPALGSGGQVYAGCRNNVLYVFTSAGSVLWSYVTGGWVDSSPALAPDGRIYFATQSSSLVAKMYALTSAGGLSWSYSPADIFKALTSPSAGAGGEFYAGSVDNRVYALASNGSLAWTYMTVGPISYSCPGIGTDGRLYFGSSDNACYVLTSAGTFAWSYITENPVYSSLAIGADGILYVGSTDNSVYALSSTGHLAWSYTTGERVDQSPAIDSDGRIYVSSGDNKLYVFEGPPTATPTTTAIPTATPPIDLTAQKVEFQTTDRIEVLADVWPISIPCYPFVRIVMPGGSTLWYESGKGFMGSPVPYLGFAAGPITVASPILGYPALQANFSGIAVGTYVLEGGAVDATKTTSADNLVYFGTVDRETLNVH